MPLNVSEQQIGGFPNPEFQTLPSFKRGVITLIAPSRLPKDAMQEAENHYLYEDGQPGTRPGVGWYGNEISTTSRVNPILTTNLIANPSIETNTTGWSLNSGGSGGTITRVSSESYVGGWSIQFDSGASNRRIVYSLTGLTPGQYYVFQVRLKATVGQGLFLRDSIGSLSIPDTNAVATGGWDLVTRTILATGTSGEVRVGTDINSTVYIDAAMVEEGTAPSDYFDGSFANTADTDYAWTGSANASTSTRTTYTLVASDIDGYDYFDFDGAIHLVAVAGGTVYRSLDDAVTWEACSGATLTVGAWTNMNQNGTFLYLTNGVDNIVRYDGTTTLQTYTALDTPGAPSAAKTGLGATTYTYYYKVSAVNGIGFTEASPNDDVQVSLTRDGWDSSSNYVTITGTVDTDSTRVDIYLSEDNLNYYYLGSAVPTAGAYSFKDDGTAIVVPSTTAPTGNTTQGPLVEELTNVGIRQYGVRDLQNRYRIWFTGAGTYAGAFSSAYDGGYLDWQPGGKYFPVHVEDYRDGKGTPIATVWCDSADGQGCILQMSLDTLTISDISITVPSAYKLPGSRGTSAPGSVVNVLNDYMFENSQAMYNLGSRAQFLNILSTDEASANIRPTVKQISSVGEPGIASVYYDAKVLFSVPRGATTNNATDMYDTERKAWIPNAFTIGFKKFLKYTDQNGSRHLLALKPGDNRLSEISESIRGDYGVAFTASLITSEQPVSRDRFAFYNIEEAEFELASVTGQINVELLGYERKNGFSIVKDKNYNFSSTLIGVGWDSFDWDTTEWDDTDDTPAVNSNRSEKRYFNVQKEMNTVQWHIYHSTLDAKYIIRTLQTWGTDTQAAHPTSWRIP